MAVSATTPRLGLADSVRHISTHMSTHIYRQEFCLRDAKLLLLVDLLLHLVLVLLQLLALLLDFLVVEVLLHQRLCVDMLTTHVCSPV